MKVELGRLRFMVTLENPSTPAADGDGSFTETPWTLIGGGLMAASIEPATARNMERTVANTVQAQTTHLMHIRYVPDVTTKTRVKFTTPTGTISYFSVTGVENVDIKFKELVLSCQEVIV
jgi:head-tail adaptor